MVVKKSRTREDLELIRTQLMAAMETAETAVMAQIAGQLRQVVKDLDALGGTTGEVSKADELADKRAARLGDAGDQSPAARRGQPRRRGGSHRAG